MKYVLAALVISSFLYAENDAAKAEILKKRQQEAIVALGNLHTAESAFFAEFGEYGTCLSFMGYAPPNGQQHYVVGFSKVKQPGAIVPPGCAGSSIETRGLFYELFKKFGFKLDFGPLTHPETNEEIGRYAFWFDMDNGVHNISLGTEVPRFWEKGATATQFTYRAVAIGNIDLDPALDVWVITEKGGMPVQLFNDATMTTWPPASR